MEVTIIFTPQNYNLQRFLNRIKFDIIEGQSGVRSC